MFTRNNKLKDQKGSLLIEALAMLALIAMVTPLLYKKAAERTSELQDINAAGQMRTISNAVDAYLRDNYDTIVTNGEVKTNCSGGAANKKYNFSGDDDNEDIPLAHLCEYLPYGFNDKTMLFSSIDVGVKRRVFKSDDTDPSTGEKRILRQDLMGLIVANPVRGANMPRVRASRIASMIGTNGGFADNKKGYGVQGVWEIDLSDFDADSFKPSGASNNSVLATSLESIASGNHGRENVLHREKVDEAGLMNTMMTDLNMGGHKITNIQQMIVHGDGLGDKDKAIYVTDGAGIYIDTGNLYVGGTVEVGGDATFHGNVTVDKLLKTLQLEVTEWLKAGSAEIIGELTAANKNFIVEAGTGNTTIKGTLNVQGDTTLDANLQVAGTSDLEGKVTIGTAAGTPGDPDDNVVLQVKGDAQFDEDISVAGTADIDNLNVRKVFQAGLGDDGNYNLKATKDSVDILVNNFQVGNPTNPAEPTGFLITEELTRMKNGTKIELESPDIILGSQNNPNMVAINDTDGVSVNDANFSVNDENDTTLFEVNKDSKEVRVKGGADLLVRAKGTTGGNGSVSGDDIIFQVEQDGSYLSSGDRDASVYVRKGVIELERNTATDANKSDKANYTGYVKLDRVVGNKDMDANAFHDDIASGGYSGIVKYDEFQVNPAYTSVMHDIKLTTRGGARLSDILPDFINKGIYVLDGTYKEKLNGKSVNWDTNDSGVPVQSSQFPYDVNKITGGADVSQAIKAESCDSNDFTCATTPWLGFIPAPSCPPGYLKVATINPIRWAMSQAGRPVQSHRPGADADEVELAYNRDPNTVKTGTGGVSEPWRNALTFQQSTWLNTSLKAFTKNGVSYGWSGIIGFIYPAEDFRVYLQAIGELSASEINSSTIVWNLFEVFNQQIVGIANVYCYFNRRSQAQLTAAGSSAKPDFENDELIDRYDQLTSIRVRYDEKESDYVKRLNDPTLKYTDPW